jgi:hypothetical protein
MRVQHTGGPSPPHLLIVLAVAAVLLHCGGQALLRKLPQLRAPHECRVRRVSRSPADPAPSPKRGPARTSSKNCSDWRMP